ncbi:SMARCE1-related [Chionoecetes opilio]|uniref:SMARCE1-related n=1 Tax=Chionoecetes opilio TaxID=41210 RepID=A0A8J4XV68_CHIOP|nr:SMARCE1-related [Chionoecetes opilio]
MIPQRADTDGETSGMGSSVDEPVESSTESASEAPSTPPAFIHPRLSASRGPSSTSPTAMKKRRGGWPKGRKRKPELPGAKPPKAPVTAYVLFLNERRKYYRETSPEMSFGAVTKVLGAEWSAMSVEQKAAFVTRSEQDKRRYRNELQAYRQSHDYQLLLRKKRIKNVIRRGGTTTEESSDFTDEIDDDESEELYCRICDQLFTSLHNKREHLYGKTHLQGLSYTRVVLSPYLQ